MLSQVKWLSLSQEVRSKIASLFQMKKSDGTSTFNNEVICDGYTPKDLLTITTEKMQSFLKSTSTDFYALFEQVLAIVHKQVEDERPVTPDIPEEPLIQIKEMADGSLNLQVSKRKPGRPKKETTI